MVTKRLEIGPDQDNLHRKFSALNGDFSSPSTNHLQYVQGGLQAHAGIKEGYPLKMVILSVLARLA